MAAGVCFLLATTSLPKAKLGSLVMHLFTCLYLILNFFGELCTVEVVSMRFQTPEISGSFLSRGNVHYGDVSNDGVLETE